MKIAARSIHFFAQLVSGHFDFGICIYRFNRETFYRRVAAFPLMLRNSWWRSNRNLARRLCGIIVAVYIFFKVFIMVSSTPLMSGTVSKEVSNPSASHGCHWKRIRERTTPILMNPDILLLSLVLHVHVED